MTQDDVTALLTALGGILVPVIGGIGALIGYRVADRKSHRDAQVAVTTVEVGAQDRLIDQLQEELGRYRDDNDARVRRLEQKVDQLTEENRGYRALVGVQRDLMAQHSIPLPPWPEGLPR